MMKLMPALHLFAFLLFLVLGAYYIIVKNKVILEKLSHSEKLFPSLDVSTINL